MKTNSNSIQKFGFGIAVLSIIALIVSFNENNFTLEDLVTMEGKVTKVQFVTGGKYANKIVSMTCQLDSSRYFSIPAKSDFWKLDDMARKLMKAKKVKLWLVKDYTSWEILDPRQLAVDDVMYIDFNSDHSQLPPNFWLFCIALVVGVGFIFLEIVMKRSVKE